MGEMPRGVQLPHHTLHLQGQEGEGHGAKFQGGGGGGRQRWKGVWRSTCPAASVLADAPGGHALSVRAPGASRPHWTL